MKAIDFIPRDMLWWALLFLDRISRQVTEGSHFGDLMISSLLFEDDVVLLASSDDGLLSGGG